MQEKTEFSLAEFDGYKHQWTIASANGWRLDGVVAPLRGSTYWLITNLKTKDVEKVYLSFEAAIRILNERIAGKW